MKKERETDPDLGKHLKKLADTFELSILEDSLRFNPENIEILVDLGNLYTKTGRYMKGLKIDKKLVSMIPENPIFHYNLACSFSLLRMIEPSLKALTTAIDLGFEDLELMENDEDLDNIRNESRFKDLLLRIRMV